MTPDRSATPDGRTPGRRGLTRSLWLGLAVLLVTAGVAALGLGLFARDEAPPPGSQDDGSPSADAGDRGDDGTSPDAAEPGSAPPGDSFGLAVSPDGRALQRADGSPFFWLGDTAWELFHRLDREGAARYLDDRAAKGFTVVQAVALAELAGTTVPNAQGHLPLVDRDPSRPDTSDGPDDDYWDDVDAVLDMAADRGLYVALLPTWGNKVDVAWGGDGDEPIFDRDNAREYGRFLGERYADQANLIWVLGGDRGPDDEHMPIWNAMADGIREADTRAHLLAYHPSGGRSSSPFTHDDDRYDVDLVQSGHCADIEEAVDLVADDYELTPPKPTMDAEPRYEDHPICWKPEQGWWDAHDARRIAWLQVFSGAFGHTYGNHNIWQFWEPGRIRVSSARTPWQEALDQPAAGQVQHVRWLVQSRPGGVPDTEVITGSTGSGESMIRALRAPDGAFLLAYAGEGDKIEVDLGSLSGDRVRVHWYDPRTGEVSEREEVANEGTPRTFDPSGEPGRTNDWVLVLDDADRGLPPPQLDRARAASRLSASLMRADGGRESGGGPALKCGLLAPSQEVSVGAAGPGAAAPT